LSNTLQKIISVLVAFSQKKDAFLKLEDTFNKIKRLGHF
jgi:hypothetical protein